MRSWNLGSGTETAKFLMWLVHYFCSRWCPCTAAARDVSPADRPCSPLCWGAPLYVHTPHAGQHAQSYVDSSGAQFPNCQDGGRRPRSRSRWALGLRLVAVAVAAAVSCVLFNQHPPTCLCFCVLLASALPPTCSCFVFSPISRSTPRQKNAALLRF